MPLRVLLIAGLAAALAACGFHLRGNVPLPAGMQRLHLAAGDGDFTRQLARALVSAGVTLEDAPGPGIAELAVPVARYSTDSLSAGGYVRITEYSVRFQVEFDVRDAAGQVLLARQRIDMSREYSFDAASRVGNAAQVEEIRRSLATDMVQAVLFRLEAAGAQAPGTPVGGA